MAGAPFPQTSVDFRGAAAAWDKGPPMLRKVVRIDEEKCDGCGLCIPACAEGAIALVGGKARLSADVLCDGLGACLGECPRGAITVVEREAVAFDEKAVVAHLLSMGERVTARHPAPAAADAVAAPWLRGADLLVAADCVPFAYARFHDDLLAGRALVVGCPKLDDLGAYVEKLGRICAENDLRSITVVRMEVPCCGGISTAARRALEASGKATPLLDVVIGVDGMVRGDG